MITKYSKSYNNMWKFKDSLTSDNRKLLEVNNRITDVYNAQPVRRRCKICGADKHRYDFHARRTKYWCCDNCGHINGWYEDTEEFCKIMYESDDGIFGGYYEDTDIDYYMDRMRTIYAPKADFMIESIEQSGENPAELKYADIGAGSGHFVTSLQEKNYNAIGIEVDKHQVRHVNNMLDREVLVHCKSEDVLTMIGETNVDVVTCIYGFEHIINVVDVFEAINRNPHIKWIYFSVPMLSVSSLLDSVNPDVYWRVLHAAHTHIYSTESIEWLCDNYKWEKKAEWVFGSDVADLLRNIMVKATENGDVEYATAIKDMFAPMIDDLQGVIDKHRMCSDIHLLVKKK